MNNHTDMPERPLDPEDLLPEPEEPRDTYDDDRQREIDEKFAKQVTDEVLDYLPALTPGFLLKRQAD